MEETVRKELLEHILETVKYVEDIEDLHFQCFNEDYYIIGHSRAINSK